MSRKPWPHREVPGLTMIAGERWADVPGLDGYVVSTLGRAVRLPGKVPQRDRYGGSFLRTVPGMIFDINEERPRLGHGPAGSRMDLGRAVLTTFVRPPVGRELAIRINLVSWDCRLENLVWSGDRRQALLARFLANDAGCLDAPDLDLAALRLGVGHTMLTRAIAAERARLGRRAPKTLHNPRQVAETLR